MVFPIGNLGHGITNYQHPQKMANNPPDYWNSEWDKKKEYLFPNIILRTGLDEHGILEKYYILEKAMNKYPRLDRNFDSTISVEEAYDPFDQRYMNKDENGNIQDTHILDYIANYYVEYIEQLKPYQPKN